MNFVGTENICNFIHFRFLLEVTNGKILLLSNQSLEGKNSMKRFLLPEVSKYHIVYYGSPFHATNLTAFLNG